MTKEIELLEKVSEILSGTAQNTVAHYSQWFFADAISYIIFGFVMVTVPLYFIIKRPYKKDELCIVYDSLMSLMVFIGLCFVFDHIGTLISPEGKAIHQFIKDIRG